MASTQQHPRVLIIDDSARVLQSIYDLLTISADYNLLAAAGGVEAMRILEASLDNPAEQIDLVLLDITMPAVDGLSVLKWLREDDRFKYMRVIMITARDEKKTIVQALSMGADDYITKPFHPQELLARVSSSLRTQRLEKQLEWQRAQLATLNQLSTRMLSVFEPTQLFEMGLNGVKELFDVDAVAVYMASATRQYLRCQHANAWRANIDTASFPDFETTASSIINQSYNRAQVVVANDGAHDPRFRPNVDGPYGLPISCMVAGPIYTHGNPVGVLVGYNHSSGAFSEADVDLFASLTGAVSLAFENAWHLHSIERQRESLRNSRNRLQAVIDGIRTPIYTIDRDWTITSINASQAAHASQNGNGTSPIGSICYERFYNRQTPCEHCQISALLASREAQQWSVQFTLSNTDHEEWDVQAYPLPRFADRDAAAVVVWQDRTEERRLERSLIQSAKLSAVGRLTAGIAHELNNPLTVISTGIEMLQVDMDPADESTQIVEWMGNATERVAQGIRGLLEIGRQSVYEFREGQVNLSLESALEMLKYQIQSVNIEAEMDLTPDLPEIVGSWQHLKTVWISILLNARDALEDVERDRHIMIRSALNEAGDKVVIRFEDTGHGMTEEQLSHVFDAFYTTKASGKGTGLGMYTSRRIIDEHGGTISAESTPDVGASFIVTLPIPTE